jgi:hypothetical protein
MPSAVNPASTSAYVKPRAVVDGDVDELPADPADTRGAVAVHAVAHAADLVELLDV